MNLLFLKNQVLNFNCSFWIKFSSFNYNFIKMIRPLHLQIILSTEVITECLKFNFFTAEAILNGSRGSRFWFAGYYITKRTCLVQISPIIKKLHTFTPTLSNIWTICFLANSFLILLIDYFFC